MMEKSTQDIDSVEFYVNKKMKEFEGKIYGLSGSKLLQFCRDEFGQPLLRENGEEYSSKSKKWILIAIRELARDIYTGEAKDLAGKEKDQLAMEASTDATEESEPNDPVIAEEVKVFISRRATEAEQINVSSSFQWTPEMSACVGRVGVVVAELESEKSCMVEVDGVTCNYPTVVLEVYDPEKHNTNTFKSEMNVEIIRKATEEEMTSVGAAWIDSMDAMVGKVACVEEVHEDVCLVKFNGQDQGWILPVVVLKASKKAWDEFKIVEVVDPSAKVSTVEKPQKIQMVEDPKNPNSGVVVNLTYTSKRNLNEQLMKLTGNAVWYSIFTSHKRMVRKVTAVLEDKNFNVKSIKRLK